MRTLVESKAFEGEGHHVDEPAIKDQRPAGDLAVDETGRLAEANNFKALAWRRRNGSEEVGHKSGLKEGKGGGSPSRLIDAKIAALSDWRGKTLARVRRLISEADPKAVEEVKWRKPSNSMLGVPVWSHAGIICTGETYKSVVKLTFAKGASLVDPAGLFNSSLEGNTRRAIDFHEGERIDEKALQALIRAAVALNGSKAKR